MGAGVSKTKKAPEPEIEAKEPERKPEVPLPRPGIQEALNDAAARTQGALTDAADTLQGAATRTIAPINNIVGSL